MNQVVEWGEAVERELTKLISKVRSQSHKADPETAEGMRSFAAYVAIQTDWIVERITSMLNSEDLLEADMHMELLIKQLEMFRGTWQTLKLYK